LHRKHNLLDQVRGLGDGVDAHGQNFLKDEPRNQSADEKDDEGNIASGPDFEPDRKNQPIDAYHHQRMNHRPRQAGKRSHVARMDLTHGHRPDYGAEGQYLGQEDTGIGIMDKREQTDHVLGTELIIGKRFKRKARPPCPAAARADWTL
ncbi:MAG TPA: hypothetical protein QF772_07235, partial [Nitrospinaceae bacterium]|nr:hypothetical protein [Nitrospinaceae bacterium]